MGKVDKVFRRQIQIGDRDVNALDLAKRIAELKLRHIFSSGKLRPAGLSDHVSRINRRSAGGTAKLRTVSNQTAPGTSMCSTHRLSSVGIVMHVHRLDADASRPGHAREIHARATKEAGR